MFFATATIMFSWRQSVRVIFAVTSPDFRGPPRRVIFPGSFAVDEIYVATATRFETKRQKGRVEVAVDTKVSQPRQARTKK